MIQFFGNPLLVIGLILFLGLAITWGKVLHWLFGEDA